MKVLLATILLALPAFAELQKLEMTLGGLDCDSCATSVDRVVKRIRGVDTATFDAKSNVVSVTFVPDNKVRVSAIRDAVKGVGYTPGEVKLTARGSLSQQGGEWQFQLAGVETKWKADVPQKLQKSSGILIVQGTLADNDVLKVLSATPAADEGK